MTFRNIQVEPAFISHEKYRKSLQLRNKSLNDCCYSISNVALIIATIISLIFTVKFLYDDTLYENGEHLLSLRFYRQLVAIIAIMPLVLLVPLFNAISAFLISSQYKLEMDATLPKVRLIFGAILSVLVVISIIFVGPYILYGNLSSQLDYEFRRHMKRRYDNDFSEVFLDSIQEEYECCDTSFYMANFPEGTPSSCFRKNGLYNSMYDRTCGDVLATLVSFRCSIIAACLGIILVALAALIVIDLIDCLTYPNQQYNIGSREAQLSSEVELDDNSEEMASLARQHGSIKQAEDCLLSSSGSRLEQSSSREIEAERERKKLLSPTRTQSKTKHSSLGDLNCDDDDDDDDDDGGIFDVINNIDKEPASTHWNNHSTTTTTTTTTTPARHLTKASYIYNNKRTQSPLFVNNSASKATQSQSNSSSSLNHQTEPPKSVLKKSSSFQRVDNNNDDDDADMEEYQKQMQRNLQTRRSLLNVRFAE